MSQILAVFGATGKQGSSVINHVLSDPELSSLFTIRALTRSTSSPAAQALSAKHSSIQIVQADMSDRTSLSSALSGVHTVFAMTTPDFGPNGFDTEYNAAKLIADVSLDQGVRYIIFSTLPNVTKISGGKYTKSVHMDAKAEAEEYIRSLSSKGMKSAFFAPGFFMENFHGLALVPIPDGSGGYFITLPTGPATRIPLIAAGADTGKFVGAILAEPDKFEGKTFVAGSGLRRLDEIAAAMSASTGKKVVYRESSVKEFKEMVGPTLGETMTETFKAMEEFGYGGEGTEEEVAWAVEIARGKVTGLEEFLAENPLGLK